MAVTEWLFLTICFVICVKGVTSIQNCASKWKSFGNSCYLFVTPSGNYGPEQKDWKGARTYCSDKGADLVSLTTAGEVKFVYGQTKTLDYDFWIGLNRSGKSSAWVWSNGDKLNLTRWNRGEPSDHDNEHCVEIIKKTKFWNNSGCNIKLAWICEKKIVTKMTQKVVTKITASRKPTVKSKQATTFISSSTKASTATITRSTSTQESTKSTKDGSSDTSSSAMSTSTALFIFLPMILLALIVVIVLLVRKNRKSNTNEKPPTSEGDREMENQQNNPRFVGVDISGYTDLHHNREPENTYVSLNMQYKNPDRPYVIENNFNYINEPARNVRQEYEDVPYVIPPRPSHNYDVPEYRS